MIIYIQNINVKEIIKLGKKYPWKRPERCPVCMDTRLWGHGYVCRYLEKCEQLVYLKRYRCPDCRSVHTCRPGEYWKGFFYSIQSIIRSLIHKIRYNSYLTDISRQVQSYWYKGLMFQISRYKNIKRPLLSDLYKLIKMNIIPVTCSRNHAILIM
jgi:hypothetical protein